MKRYITSSIKSVEDEPFSIQLEIARTSSDIDLLEQLVADPRFAMEMTKNPNITEDLAWNIWNMHEMVAASGLAENPSTPPEILEKIAHDSRYVSISEKLAKNPNTPTDVLQKIYRDSKSNLAMRYAKKTLLSRGSDL